MTACVIPCFRAADSICETVRSVLSYVDYVIVVDDCCPDGSGDRVAERFNANPRVEVIRHVTNRGVGGATKTGWRRCLTLGVEYIVKLDADGQMDPSYIPQMRSLLDGNPATALVKGNRFGCRSVTRLMPALRLVGNSILTLLVRVATGYWNSIDPTNGYFMIRSSALRRIDIDQLAERFFFEIAVLAAFGLRKTAIAEMEMPARYGNERSNLSIAKAVMTFPGHLGATLIKRVLWQYLIFDMNAGSLFLAVGSGLLFVGAGLGGYWWDEALRSGIARTPGTVTLALLPLIMGFQLLLNAVLYDVQTAARVLKYQPYDIVTYDDIDAGSVSSNGSGVMPTVLRR